MIRKKPDPIEHSMEIALKPGRFIRYDDAFEFVQGLETVKSAVVRVIKTDPQPGSSSPRRH